jgi:hypothetical protein
LANRLCNPIVYHLLRCHPGKFRIFLVLLIIAKKICRDGVSDCQELYCTHEEADTRMTLFRSHRIKKSVSGDLTMIRPLIPLSPNVLSAWIACKIIRVSASSCVQYNSWQSETSSLQIFLAMIRSTRKIWNFPR